MGYEVKTTDPIVIEIIKKIDERSLEGQRKYGGKMMDEITDGKKDLKRFMVDVQEEMTDMLLYMESARHCLQQEIEECYINDKHEPVVLESVPSRGPCSSHQVDLEEMIEDEEHQKRLRVIGQNGNTGEHYNDHHLDVDELWTSNQT